MQVLPSTAAAPPLNIRGVDRDVQANVDAGAAYLRLVRDRYVNDPTLKDPDRTLMTFAAYNAGPGNFWRIRDAAVARGLDPHVWFNSVEAEAANSSDAKPSNMSRTSSSTTFHSNWPRNASRRRRRANLRLSKRTGIRSWTKAAPGRVSMSLNRALGGVEMAGRRLASAEGSTNRRAKRMPGVGRTVLATSRTAASSNSGRHSSMVWRLGASGRLRNDRYRARRWLNKPFVYDCGG